MVEDFREEKDCLVCGNASKKIVHQWPSENYPHDKYETASWDGRQKIPLQIVQCKSCRFIYTSPAFKPQHLDKVYPEDIVPKNINIDRQMSYQKWSDILVAAKRYLNPKDVICDIGTRYGVLVKLLHKNGFPNSFGIEYNPEAVKRGHQNGIKKVYQGDTFTLKETLAINNLPTPKAYVMVDVLEHLPYPEKDLEKLAENMETGGLLFLKQMDVKSLGVKIFGKNWYYWQPAAHMGFFDKKSTKNLLEKTGFEMVEVIRPNVKAQVKESLLQFRKFLKNLGGHSDGVLYTQKRYHLSDMFLVVARKI